MLQSHPASVNTILHGLIDLQRKYAFTKRKMVTEERYTLLREKPATEDISLDDALVREPLIEHVGHLPIIASYLHQYLEQKDDIDLGKVLTMLAVHDIAETRLGDKLTYTKSEHEQVQETTVARDMLPDYLFAYVAEFERQDSLDAKFAKSVDSIAPLLHEVVMPEVTIKRMKLHSFTVDMVIKKKRSHFLWSPTLLALFDHVIELHYVQ